LLRPAPFVRLPIPFRGLSQHPRTVPGSRRIHAANDASFPGLSRPTTHPGTAGRLRGASSPAARRVRFGYLPRGLTTIPAETFRPPSVHGLHPSRPSPRAGRTPFREFLPSCRFPRRFASPLRSVRTRSASGPRSRRRARSDRRTLAGPTRRCLPGFRPSRAFSPSVLASASFVRAHSPITRWAGLTSRPACVSGSCGAEGSALPLSGPPALLGFFTFRLSRHHENRSRGRAHCFASRTAACTRHSPI
jgi:hypothetical protein